MRKIFITIWCLFLGLGLIAQDVSEIDYDGNNEHEHYGWTLAMDGDWLVVGSPHTETSSGSDAGKVVIYQKNGTAWNLFQELSDDNGNAFQNYGFTIDIKNEVMVVGAIGSFDEGPFTGRALVYQFDGNTWALSSVLLASDASAGHHFGHSVATDGSRVVVGAIKADGLQSRTGAVYIFENEGNNWVFGQKITADDGASNDNFGYDIDINDNGRIVVGSPNQTDFIDKSGAAYVFDEGGGNYVQSVKLKAVGRSVKDYLGTSVAINGDDVIAGAYLADGVTNNSGSAYYFAFDNDQWKERQQIIYSDGTLNDYFGRNIAMSDFRLFVGAPKVNLGGANDVGQSYYYEKEGGLWRFKQVIDEPEGTANNYFGTSVAISDTDLAIGARLNDSDNVDGGAVYTAALGVVTSNEDEITVSRAIELVNFPNPTQQEVTIMYKLHKPSRVAIEIFDSNGAPIKDLLSESIQDPGKHEVKWDLEAYNGSRVPAGLYLYKLSIDGSVFTKKIIVTD